MGDVLVLRLGFGDQWLHGLRGSLPCCGYERLRIVTPLLYAADDPQRLFLSPCKRPSLGEHKGARLPVDEAVKEVARGHLAKRVVLPVAAPSVCLLAEHEEVAAVLVVCRLRRLEDGLGVLHVMED